MITDLNFLNNSFTNAGNNIDSLIYNLKLCHNLIIRRNRKNKSIDDESIDINENIVSIKNMIQGMKKMALNVDKIKKECLK